RLWQVAVWVCGSAARDGRARLLPSRPSTPRDAGSAGASPSQTERKQSLRSSPPRGTAAGEERLACPPRSRWAVLNPRRRRMQAAWLLLLLAPAVDVEVFETDVPTTGWPKAWPEATERYTEPAFALFHLPWRYTGTGVRAQRPNPLLMRAAVTST